MRAEAELPGVPDESIPREGSPPSKPKGLTGEHRRWLHDKYQKFDLSEGQLADYRSSYTAAVTTALVAAMVYAVVNLLPRGGLVFAGTVSLLASFGILISVVWAIVLRRTTEAQNLWREAALQLEELAPPVEASLIVPITIRGGQSISVDLARPYHAHFERFSAKNHVPWLDQVRPSELSSQVPVLLIGVWIMVVIAVWVWFFLLG
jgi:hypothetical protein